MILRRHVTWECGRKIKFNKNEKIADEGGMRNTESNCAAGRASPFLCWKEGQARKPPLNGTLTQSLHHASRGQPCSKWLQVQVTVLKEERGLLLCCVHLDVEAFRVGRQVETPATAERRNICHWASHRLEYRCQRFVDHGEAFFLQVHSRGAGLRHEHPAGRKPRYRKLVEILRIRPWGKLCVWNDSCATSPPQETCIFYIREWEKIRLTMEPSGRRSPNHAFVKGHFVSPLRPHPRSVPGRWLADDTFIPGRWMADEKSRLFHETVRTV